MKHQEISLYMFYSPTARAKFLFRSDHVGTLASQLVFAFVLGATFFAVNAAAGPRFGFIDEVKDFLGLQPMTMGVLKATADNGTQGRIFNIGGVTPSGAVTISGLTITNGYLNRTPDPDEGVGGAFELPTTVSSPGTLSFSSPTYDVTAGNNATITVNRTGGTDNQVVGKVTLTDVTTSPADYRFTPGARDTTFNTGGVGANSSVFAVALQPDGKIVIGGNFTSYNGDAAASDRVMRLNADGTRDTTFNTGGAGVNGEVAGVAVQPDGKIVIGGNFTSYNGDAAVPDNIMRLNGATSPATMATRRRAIRSCGSTPMGRETPPSTPEVLERITV